MRVVHRLVEVEPRLGQRERGRHGQCDLRYNVSGLTLQIRLELHERGARPVGERLHRAIVTT